MGNVFDQVDSPPLQSRDGRNPFDQFDAAPRTASGQIYTDADLGLTYGPGSAYSGKFATGAQQAYASATAAMRDPSAPAGTATNPSYDTPDLTGGPGVYHVTPQGQLSAPAVAGTLTDADLGLHYGEEPGSSGTRTAHPVSNSLGFLEGVDTVARNLGSAMQGVLPGTENNPVNLPRIVASFPFRAAENQLQGYFRGAEKTATPGIAGRIGGELVASSPFAVEGGPLITGAMQGYLTSDADPNSPLARLKDIVAGAVGGKIGDKAFAALKGIASPAVRDATQWAADHGIRLTPGGAAGGFFRWLENGAAKGTVAGPAVGAAQRRAIEDFNVATARNAVNAAGLDLPPNVQAGHQVINAAHQVLSDGYSALTPHLALPGDQQLTSAAAEAQKAAKLLPSAYQSRVNSFVSQVPKPGSVMTGAGVSDLTSALRAEASDGLSSNDFFAKKYGQAIDDLRSSIEDALERSNPQYAQNLQGLRQGWAQLVRIERAGRDAVQDGGIYTPKGLLSAVRSTDQSARDNATAQGEALLQDWATRGKEVMPDKLPAASNFWAHLPEIAVALGVGKEAHMPGLAALLGGEGALAGLYTKPGQAVTNAVLTKRPQFVRDIAEWAQNFRPLAGYTSATALPKIVPYASAPTALESLKQFSVQPAAQAQ